MTKHLIIIISLLFSFNAQARSQLRIVGSSTLYPFITIAAEKFGKSSGHTPVVEATGTGGGFLFLCSGNSLRYPDIVNASRAIKPSEQALCQKNNVLNIKEITLGYDGIVIAQSKGAKNLNLSKQELYLALAKKVNRDGKLVDNFYITWKDINPKLPKNKIEIYGPSFNSGTRDALIELVMHEFCETDECKEIREDGAYIEMPENDNLIIHKLLYNRKALGIMSFSLLNENTKIKPISIDNIIPTRNSIIDEEYPLERPLFIYVNEDHMRLLPDLEKFITHLTSSDSIGPNGYLTKKGLLTKSTHDKFQ